LDQTAVVKLDIHNELAPDWRRVLEREVNLSLAPVRGRLRAARIRFAGALLPDSEEPGYRCVFTGRGIHGETYYSEADSLDGRAAIQGALIRVRRDVVRRCQSFRGPGRP
jgi:hypothetical protein